MRRARFLELVTLWSFAAAQPLLDVFGRSPETFVFRGADRWTIVGFAVVVVVSVKLVVLML